MAPASFPMNPNKEAVRWKLRCISCKQRVTATDALRGHAYFALGGLWHAKHMVCAKCNINVAEIPFCESATEPNVLMCTDCYMIESNPDCAACGKRLFETCVEAAGRLYHKDCLRCTACKLPCVEGRYEIDDTTGAIYDVDCYHLMVLNKDYGCAFGGAKGATSAEKTEEHHA